MTTTYPAPTPEEIDKRLAAYAELELAADQAEKHRAEFEAELIPFIKQFGRRDDKATESVRIAGHHNEALVTYGVTKTLNVGRIENLRIYLAQHSLIWLFNKMFESSTKWSLVTGAHDALAGHELPKRTREKALQLFGLCTDLKDKKPSLKVTTIKVKPAKKARGGKAAA